MALKTATEQLEEQLFRHEPTHRFLRKYAIEANISNRVYRTYRRMAYSDWIHQSSPIPFDVPIQEEPYIALHIPQSQLYDLVEREEYLTKLENELDYNQRIVNMLRADERVRDDNPAVAKAYRNYLALLELART